MSECGMGGGESEEQVVGSLNPRRWAGGSPLFFIMEPSLQQTSTGLIGHFAAPIGWEQICAPR